MTYFIAGFMIFHGLGGVMMIQVPDHFHDQTTAQTAGETSRRDDSCESQRQNPGNCADVEVKFDKHETC